MRDHGDAMAAKLVFQSQPVEIVRDNGDANAARLAPQPQASRAVEVVRDHGDATAAKLGLQSSPVIVRDHGDASDAKLALQAQPESLPVASSSTTTGSDIDWSQLGIGFGLGVFLVAGVIFAFRFTRSRTLAH